VLAAASVGGTGSARAGGDAAAGKAKIVACEACHTAISAQSATPHLAGQRESYLAKQLKAFKAGDRKDPFMSAIAMQLSEADIGNMAAYWSSQAAGSDATTSEIAMAARKTHMAFPPEFPRGFVLYLTANDADRNTVNKYYINTAGFAAAKANQPLPSGTVVIVSHASAKLAANNKPIAAKDGSWTVDKLDSYAAMETRTGWGKDIPELLRNEDWNYALFNPDKTAHNEVNQAACLACHKPQAAVSYVFSFKELRDKAGAR
jgi:cytochrome c553